ncbi:MAG: hypothetical protein IKE74_04730 [Mogibacterium sp.]|nr:hypothetical protein [Mogibacterium sp.]
MSTVFKRTFGIISLIIAVLGSVLVLEEFVTKRYDLEALLLKGFYEEKKDTIDVVVMGASEITLGYSAPEVYRNFGFTSYPYAFTINPVPLWKYEMRDIERTQHPKVLVVEINGAIYLEDKYIHRKGSFTRLVENMPLSMNKIEMINEMSDDPVESYFPICKYHDSWSEFPQEDVPDILMLRKKGHAVLRGAQSNLYRQKIDHYPYYPSEDEMMDLNPDAEAALRDFIKECKDSSIEHVLFICYPHIMAKEEYYERQMRCNRAGEIIREEGMDYVDFDRMLDEIGLDESDFFDDHHMNAPGQRKFSNYLGKYLQEKYDLQPTELSEKDREEWAESVDYIDRFYRYYDEYTKAHADDPYTKPDIKLRDRVRAIKVLDEMKDAG